MSPEKQKPEMKLTTRGKVALGLAATVATLYGGNALSSDDNHAEKSVYHVVEQGETLTSIVKDELDVEPNDFNETVYDTLHDPENAEELGEDNPSSENLQPGQTIKVTIP